MNIHGNNEVRQTEIHTAEPLVPTPSVSEIESYCKAKDIDQMPEELITEGGRTIHFQIHKLIHSICNKEELPKEWKESIVPIYKRGDKRQ